MERAVIFDFDGTIVDTEKTMFDFFKEELAKHQIFLKDEDITLKIGRSTKTFLESLKGKYDMSSVDIKELVEKRRKAFLDDIPKYTKLVDGIGEVLHLLKNAGFRLAIASGSQRVAIEKVLEYYKLLDLFDVIVSLEDSYEKPHPGIYVKCLARLGISKDQAVAVEDSLTGMISAKNAGLKTIAVSENSVGGADYSIKSIKQLTPELVGKVFEDRI